MQPEKRNMLESHGVHWQGWQLSPSDIIRKRILFLSADPENREALLKSNWNLHLYTNELPHLTFVFFLQSNHDWLNNERELTNFQKQKKVDTHLANLTIRLASELSFPERSHLWILREAIQVRGETKKPVCQMALDLLSCKFVEIRLTSKTWTCYPLGLIATELARKTQSYRHQPTRMEHTVMSWKCYH